MVALSLFDLSEEYAPGVPPYHPSRDENACPGCLAHPLEDCAGCGAPASVALSAGEHAMTLCERCYSVVLDIRASAQEQRERMAPNTAAMIAGRQKLREREQEERQTQQTQQTQYPAPQERQTRQEQRERERLARQRKRAQARERYQQERERERQERQQERAQSRAQARQQARRGAQGRNVPTRGAGVLTARTTRQEAQTRQTYQTHQTHQGRPSRRADRRELASVVSVASRGYAERGDVA